MNSVLEISWAEVLKDGITVYSGSGFLISDDGYAITNAHVVLGNEYKPAKELKVKIAGETVTAKIVSLGDEKGSDGEGEDLALIKLNRVPKKAKSVRLEDFGNVRNGQQIYIIGNPVGLGISITMGIVSERLRDFSGKPRLLTDCAVNKGNSGGPAFNVNGNVIGAAVASLTNREGMHLVIPSTVIQDFLSETHRIR